MKKIIFLIAILPFISGSCVGVKYTTFEIKEPAKITLPPEIVNLVIVDNVLVPSYEGDSEKIPSDAVTYDSAKIEFVEALHEKLYDADFFGDVQIYPYEMRTDKNYWEELPLSKEQIVAICDETDSDALVSFNSFGMSSAMVEIPSYFGLAKEMSLHVQALLRVYGRSGTELTVPISFNDTLIWSELYPDPPFYQPLPSMKEMVEQGIEIMIGSLDKVFIPYWQSHTRSYFPDKETEKLIEKNNWEEAQAIWVKAFADEKKEPKQSRLASNIALSYEYMDDIDQANEWIEKAVELSSKSQNQNVNAHILLYREILKERKVTREKLKLQIGE